MKKLELSSHALRAQIRLQDTYHPVRYHSGHVALRCSFPDFKPVQPDVPMGDEMIDLHISLQKGMGRAEQLLNGDGPVFEPAYLRNIHCLEQIGRYHIYQEERFQSGVRFALLSYVFLADDGAVVGVEDAGEAMDRYQITRKVGKFVQVQSLISKEFGDDFIDLDIGIGDFVKSILLRAWEVPPYAE